MRKQRFVCKPDINLTQVVRNALDKQGSSGVWESTAVILGASPPTLCLHGPQQPLFPCLFPESRVMIRATLFL